jgi:23S rRNA (pseudouridine1915-N3)-methyltransferase
LKRVEILAVGRLKDKALDQLCEDFYRRCRRQVDLEQRELKDLRALERAVKPRSFVVACDERGELLASRPLARKLQGWIERPEVQQVAFLIGGADGLGPAWRKRADFLLSLSPLTFSHRVARVVLAEQIYRAISIIQGSPYHRD